MGLTFVNPLERWGAIFPNRVRPSQRKYMAVTRLSRVTASYGALPMRKLIHIAGKAITGANYRPACGKCDALPWDPCKCSGLLNLERVDSGREQIQAHAMRGLGMAGLGNSEADGRLNVVLA